MVKMKVMRAALILLLATQVCSSFWLGMCGGRTEANGICQRHGGHLLHIDNIQENNCLMKEAMSRKKHGLWWHNANDRQASPLFRWTTGIFAFVWHYPVIRHYYLMTGRCSTVKPKYT
eukprot:GFUD01135747.1.p1 GENE.GFUD01135747.1~~GFUD01135747.1.p1  ORF type:complete len:118 (+),score=11.44 GFUD01135747.1:56-409(+)